MLTNTAISGLLGTLLLAVGLPASASNDATPTGSPAAETTEGLAEGAAEAPKTVRVVVSMPNGRRFVIEQSAPEPVGSESVEASSVSRILPDGSRISYGTGGNAKRATGSRRGSASKGSAATRGGGSGGGSTLASRSGGGGGGGGGGGSAGGGGGGGGGSGGGASGAGGRDMSAPGGVGGGAAPVRGQFTKAPDSKPVPTIGNPQYDNGGALGGQDVKFHDAGISALVVGRTVLIWGAEIVQSTEGFTLVEGERFAFDGAVMRQNSNPPAVLQGHNSLAQVYAPLKLEFPADTTTTLTLFSQPDNPNAPDREMRTWTFRVR